MNVDKLKRKVRSKPQINLDAMVFSNGQDYKTTVLGKERLLSNIESHLKKPRSRKHGSIDSKARRIYTDAELSPKELRFDKFVK